MIIVALLLNPDLGLATPEKVIGRSLACLDRYVDAEVVSV